MDWSKHAKRTFHIGRNVDIGFPTPAFDLRRREDGGLSISNIKDAPSDAERQKLYKHFGTALDCDVGGRGENGALWEGTERKEPGDDRHFAEAVYRLPPPFILLGSKE